MSRRNSAYSLLLIAVMLAAFALRVIGLGHQELRGDEAFGYFFVQQGYSAIIDATVALKEPHPVASYFVLKSWLVVAGNSEYALRWVSVFFGVLSVALLAPLAMQLRLRRRVALLAAFAMAISPYAIWHSHDARMYAMSLALNTALIILAIQALTRRRWPWVAGYIAVALLALHTHYFSALTIAALTIFIVLRAIFIPAARRALLDWVLWNIVLGALYMPWLMRAGETLSVYGGNGDSPGFFDMMWRSVSVFAAGESLPMGVRKWVAALALLLIALGALRLWLGGRDSRRTLGLLACLLAVPVLLAWYGSWTRPIFNERYLVNAAPAFTLLVASSVFPIPRRKAWLDWLAAVLLILLLSLNALSLWNASTQPEYSKTRGWRELAAQMSDAALGMPPDQVRFAQSYPDPTLWYYTDLLGSKVEHLVLPPAAHDGESAQREVDALAQAGVSRIALAAQPSPAWDDTGIAQEALAAQFDKAASTPIGAWTFELWSRAELTDTAPLAAFGSAIDLGAANVQPDALTPGGTLIATLLWTAAAAHLPDSLTATVQLLGPDGSVVAQQDRPLHLTAGEKELRVPYAILLPRALAAGGYQLIVAIYDAGEDGYPRLLTNEGADHVVMRDWQLPEQVPFTP